MKQLTKAEEEVMQILWHLEKCNVASIIAKLPEPKPAYNTVSTIVRILESKDFVDYEKVGKGHVYFPVVKKSDYSNQSINKLVDGYFQGSFLGAFIGELMNNADKKTAAKAAFGSFLGFLTGSFLKFVVAVVFMGIFISTVWEYKEALFSFFYN